MSRSALVMVLVALLVGGTLGYVLGHGAVAPERPGGSDGGDSPRAAGGDATRSSRPARDANAPTAIDPAVGVPDVSVDAPPRGHGRITGVVRDDQGRALGDVLIRATLRMPPASAAPSGSDTVPIDPPLEYVAREAVARELRQRAYRIETWSGPDGCYELGGLPAERIRLRAYRAGYKIAPVPATAWRASPGEIRDWQAQRMTSLNVSVIGVAGDPPETARLSCRSHGFRRSMAWSPASPMVSLPPGEWTLTALAGEVEELASNETRATLEPGSPTETTLRLRERPGLFGHVRADLRIPVSVRVLPLPLDAEIDLARLLAEGRQARILRVKVDSPYFLNLTDGRHLAGLVIGGARVLETAVIEIAGGRVTRDFTVPAPGPEDHLVLRAEAPDGRLLGALGASTYFLGKPRGCYGAGPALRQTDGTWLVPRPRRPDGSVPSGGRFFLSVRSPEFGPMRVPYDGPSTPSVRVRFEPPSALTIALAGYRGSEYVGRTVLQLWQMDDGERLIVPPTQYRIADDGTLIYDPLIPGEYVLEIVAEIGGGSRVPFLEHRVSIRSGEQRLEIDLPKLHTLTVVIEGFDSRARFSVRRAFPRPWDAPWERAVNGRVVFPRLPEGTYELRSSAGPTRTVVLPPAGAVIFRRE